MFSFDDRSIAKNIAFSSFNLNSPSVWWCNGTRCAFGLWIHFFLLWYDDAKLCCCVLNRKTLHFWHFHLSTPLGHRLSHPLEVVVIEDKKKTWPCYGFAHFALTTAISHCWPIASRSSSCTSPFNKCSLIHIPLLHTAASHLVQVIWHFMIFTTLLTTWIINGFAKHCHNFGPRGSTCSSSLRAIWKWMWLDREVIKPWMMLDVLAQHNLPHCLAHWHYTGREYELICLYTPLWDNPHCVVTGWEQDTMLAKYLKEGWILSVWTVVGLLTVIEAN